MIYKHTFSKPVCYEENTYTEMTFDFGKLTGKDGLAIERELMNQGIPVTVPTLMGDYLVRVCAKASDAPIGVDFFEGVSLTDWTTIRGRARNFMLTTEA